MTKTSDRRRKSLAIVGAGSSGLVTLKMIRQKMPELEVFCFEKSSNTLGAWGKTYKGFVSTSTKYTTQFACYKKFDSTVLSQNDRKFSEFFKDSEYGSYLSSFKEENQLDGFIHKNHSVEKIVRIDSSWQLSVKSDSELKQYLFDYLIICTGLAERPKEIESEVSVLLSLNEEKPITNKKIVVVGGGESATDIANRLAMSSKNNQVYMSLKTGIRVSPRLHPIKGVPSDFLRNRLLISIHEDIRNAVGQKFVEARIKHQERFEKFFKVRKKKNNLPDSISDKRKYWDTKLTKRAKGSLFNMFHNKSDMFLDAVAEDRIKIIGSNVDEKYQTFYDFDKVNKININPDYLVPMIGYESNLHKISNNLIKASDFYLGCQHVEYDNLFLIGFARPIIGNIPSISEMQARYVVGLINGDYQRPKNIASSYERERKDLKTRYPKLNVDLMYPVDMVPYCDKLAKKMGILPRLSKLRSVRRWIKILLSPFSTTHYLSDDFDPDYIDRQRVYSPLIITSILLIIKFFDIPYKMVKNLMKPGKTPSME